MRAFSLAFCFLRVPRLFVSLLLWPLVLGLVVVVVQLFFSAAVIRFYNEDAQQFQGRVTREPEGDMLRNILYGSKDQLRPLTICRWIMKDGEEVPPDANCEPRRLDVLLKVENVASFDAKDYASIFNGSTERLHICRSCTGPIEVTLGGPEPLSKVTSLAGVGVYLLSDYERFQDISQHLVKALSDRDQIDKLHGEILFQPPGLRHPINVTNAQTTMVLILNVAMIIVVALWLALKAHRRVLDYFVKNDALLPLVAACGKDTVYRALWILTLARVTLFLLTSLVPVCLIFDAAGKFGDVSFFAADRQHMFLWLVSVVAGLSTIAIFVSIADLKQRHPWHGIAFRVGPLALWFGGSVLWLVSWFYTGTLPEALQSLIESLPVVGLSSIVLAPLVLTSQATLFAHAAFSLMVTVWLLRKNTNWFGAHLEEL